MTKQHPGHPSRKTGLTPLFLGLILLASNASYSAPLQRVENLEELGQTIREKKIPLLLAFEADHCNYCQRLKTDHLQPMNNNAGYREKILIRTIKIDSPDEIINFNGEKITAASLSKQYKVFLTPTMLLLNDKGEEIAKRILGYNSPDYFGLYLDQAIDTAGKRINEATD